MDKENVEQTNWNKQKSGRNTICMNLYDILTCVLASNSPIQKIQYANFD